jgi:phage terminase small subunit
MRSHTQNVIDAVLLAQSLTERAQTRNSSEHLVVAGELLAEAKQHLLTARGEEEALQNSDAA